MRRIEYFQTTKTNLHASEGLVHLLTMVILKSGPRLDIARVLRFDFLKLQITSLVALVTRQDEEKK